MARVKVAWFRSVMVGVVEAVVVAGVSYREMVRGIRRSGEGRD